MIGAQKWTVLGPTGLFQKEVAPAFAAPLSGGASGGGAIQGGEGAPGGGVGIPGAILSGMTADGIGEDDTLGVTMRPRPAPVTATATHRARTLSGWQARLGLTHQPG